MGKIHDKFKNKQAKPGYASKAVNPDIDKFGLVDLMFKLGDGDWADQNRATLLDQVLDTVINNLSVVTANLSRGKTTEANGIQFGFERDKMTTICNYHIWIEDPYFIPAIQEFKQKFNMDPKVKLELGMMGSKDNKTIVPFFAYMGTESTIIVTKDPVMGHALRFIPKHTVAKFDADMNNLDKTAKEMADFLSV